MTAKSELSADVSIHAPARGATKRPPKPVNLRKFQFTLPRGERPRRGYYSVKYDGFNSRSREGSDDKYLRVSTELHVSIHAPARGAT